MAGHSGRSHTKVGPCRRLDLHLTADGPDTTGGGSPHQTGDRARWSGVVALIVFESLGTSFGQLGEGRKRLHRPSPCGPVDAGRRRFPDVGGGASQERPGSRPRCNLPHESMCND